MSFFLTVAVDFSYASDFYFRYTPTKIIYSLAGKAFFKNMADFNFLIYPTKSLFQILMNNRLIIHSLD